MQWTFHVSRTKRRYPVGYRLFDAIPLLQTVNFAVLLLKVLRVDRRVELFAKRLLQERAGLFEAAVLPDVLAVPRVDGREVTALQAVLHVDRFLHLAQQLRAAGADTGLCAPFAQALQNVSGGAETYFAVLTRSHAFDLDCLTLILQKPAAYVGMMGSRGRAALVRRQLLETGLDSQRVESLCAPIGLSIGAQTAAEIALSILAQIVQVKNARPQTEGYPIALLDAMVQAENARTPAVLATIVARHGSTPRDVGAKMLILPDGSTVGSVGGGIMEHYTVQAARKMLAQAAPALQCLQLSADGKNEDAAIAACGGSMEVLLQTLCPGEETK